MLHSPPASIQLAPPYILRVGSRKIALDEFGSSWEHREQLIYRIDDAHPESAAVEGEAESGERLKDRVLTYRGQLALTSDEKAFHYSAARTLLRDGAVLRTRSWKEDIPRDLQ